MGLRHPGRSAAAIAVLSMLTLGSGCSDGDRERRRAAAGPNPTRMALARVADPASGAIIFNRCAACHSIRRGAPDRNGPNLHGVMGAPAGAVSPRFGYTAALRTAGWRWTPTRMDAWLTNPRALVPGTSMTFDGLDDPLDRADVIAYLQTQR